MKERTTYAVFCLNVATDYEPHPVWRQYDGWEESRERAEHTLQAARQNTRFAETKVVKRTETFEDCEVRNDG